MIAAETFAFSVHQIRPSPEEPSLFRVVVPGIIMWPLAFGCHRSISQPTRVPHVVCNTLTPSRNYHILFLQNLFNINILTQNVHINEFNNLIK